MQLRVTSRFTICDLWLLCLSDSTPLFFFIPVQMILPSSSSAFLQLITDKLFTAKESPLPSLCLISSHPIPVLLCATSCISTSQWRATIVPDLYFPTVYHYVSCKYLLLHRTTMCSCYLYKNVVISHKN